MQVTYFISPNCTLGEDVAVTSANAMEMAHRITSDCSIYNYYTFHVYLHKDHSKTSLQSSLPRRISPGRCRTWTSQRRSFRPIPLRTRSQMHPIRASDPSFWCRRSSTDRKGEQLQLRDAMLAISPLPLRWPHEMLLKFETDLYIRGKDEARATSQA